MCRLIFYLAKLSDGYDDVYPSRKCAYNCTAARPIKRMCMCTLQVGQRMAAFEILLRYLQGGWSTRSIKATTQDLKSLRKRIRQYMIDQEPDLNG